MGNYTYDMLDLPSACACLGPQFNEPHCPCTMRRLHLPPSEERLADLAYWDSPEGKLERPQN